MEIIVRRLKIRWDAFLTKLHVLEIFGFSRQSEIGIIKENGGHPRSSRGNAPGVTMKVSKPLKLTYTIMMCLEMMGKSP